MTPSSPTRTRSVVVGYIVLGLAVAGAIAVSLSVGRGEHAKPRLGGTYTAASSSGCLPETFTVLQSGSFATVSGAGGTGGEVRVTSKGLLHGMVRCSGGMHARLSLLARRIASSGLGNTTVILSGRVQGRSFVARGTLSATTTATAKRKSSASRSAEETFGRLAIAIAAAILASRLVGQALRLARQPQVMGEVVAGILLGPSLLGAVAPGVETALFPPDIVSLLTGAADIGLAFYLFLVGIEVDPAALRGRVSLAALVSNASVGIPMALGFLAAIPLFPLLAPDVPYLPFALFSGLALSITAFPVLARILVERRMLKAPVGALALAAASADDVTAWLLLAIASAAVQGEGSAGRVFEVLAFTGLFIVAMATVVRRVLSKVAVAYDEAGHVPVAWMTAIFVGVLLSSFTAQRIGVATIFGAFVFGLVMPRRADLSGEVAERLESFVITVLLPLFFVVNGLKVDVTGLQSIKLWGIAVAILGIAVIGKWGAATLAARIGGMSARESIALGALMNTRGLTELVVLNVGLDVGVITPKLFTILVLMALATTLATGPALRLIDPRGELSSPSTDALARQSATELEEAPPHAILVAALDERNVEALVSIGTALARSQPARELVIARVLEPASFAVGPSTDERALERAAETLAGYRRAIERSGISTRVAAFTSPTPGKDVVRLATEQAVDVVIVDGRRPLLGEVIPHGDVGEVLGAAPCDAAVLITHERQMTIDEAHPVVVPFGGAEHDWAALELAAWLAASHGASLKLVGLQAQDDDRRDSSRLLADASLVVQQMSGVAAMPVLVEANARAVVEATRGAGIVLVGVSRRWREEGIGARRSLLVRRVEAPIVFVRRGLRDGALTGRADATTFTWSQLGLTETETEGNQ